MSAPATPRPDGAAAAPRVGYCRPTRTGDAGDCRRGAQGSWLLPAEGNWSGEAGCLARCRGCGNCRYVSVSLRERDCSWYRECSLDGLQTAFSAGHRTYPVERPVT